MSHLGQAGKHYLKSQVLPSMKKKAVYTCNIVLSTIGNVLRAKCGCPAGVDGHCNHVTACLFIAWHVCLPLKSYANKGTLQQNRLTPVHLSRANGMFCFI